MLSGSITRFTGAAETRVGKDSPKEQIPLPIIGGLRRGMETLCPLKFFLRFGDTEKRRSTAGLLISYKLRPCWDVIIAWSDFKPDFSFGFLSPNYMGHVT